MAQNITLLGASYSDVPSVLLPKTGGGTASFTDVTVTTAAAADVASGKIFFAADGTQTTGTASGGGGSSYTLLGSKEISANTTSTTTTLITGGSITANRDSNTAKLLYIQVRDKAGKRNGYFYGSDTFWYQPIGGATSNNYRLMTILATNSSGKVECTSTSQYGVFPKSPPTFSSGSVTVEMQTRYNSNYSRTVNGTYVVKVYDLAWPDNATPFT